MGNLVNIGMPTALLIIAISSFIWFGIEVKRKRLDFKSMAVWLTLNIIFTIGIVYVLIISILNYYYINAINIFNWLGEDVFGISMPNNKEWIIVSIFFFISYILVKSLRNSIQIAKLNKRVDELGVEVAILSGKVNKTAKFASEIAVPQKTSRDVKTELKEKIKIAKAQKKTEEKLKTINSKTPKTIEIKFGSKRNKK